MRAGNRRLADVDPDTLSAADLAGHLGAALEWYERGWTLHWTRPREDARQRFGALYRELTGEEDASRWRDLLTDEPNKMSDAVEGLAALAASVREQPRLQALLAQESPERVLATLDGVPGGADFRRRLDDFLDPERQGLRSGSSWGVEQNQVLPAWRDHPELVLALVRTYLGMGPTSLSAARTAAIARRDQRVAEARDAITESGRRAEFDRALARRAAGDAGPGRPQLLHRLGRRGAAAPGHQRRRAAPGRGGSPGAGGRRLVAARGPGAGGPQGARRPP